TSSARDLQVLCHTDQIADSPFFNIFTNVYLRPFTPEEAASLVRDPSQAVGVALEPYLRQIIEIGGYFPFFLQIGCSNYFDHILENATVVDRVRIEEGFMDEARVHFRYIWEHFSDEEREVMEAFAEGKEVKKRHAHVFEELRRSGYFIEESGTTRIFSRLFAAVVSNPRMIFVTSSRRLDNKHLEKYEYFDNSDEYIPPTDPVIEPTSLRKPKRFHDSLDDSSEFVEHKQIGRFEIINRLGQGGMGEVLLARDSELGRHVAIKLLRSRYASDEKIRRRFLREAQTASMITHPNIATIYEIGEIDSVPYIVMEYVKGFTLSEHLKNSPFKISEVVSIGEQVALALAEAHAAGIIHRDIKSSNIILNEKNRVKVLDFGLAKPGIFDPTEKTDPSSRITEPGILLGTVNYMSPEQASGTDKIDHRGDIFSLGIVLYEITTGKLPFDGNTYFQIMEALTKQEPTPIIELRHDTPAKLDAVIMKCLAKQPENRFQSAQELAESLSTLGKV
ncbi:MAG: serine/threonine protein kinase, partial [Blastocatellia bacterium]|nr:serine/threonine protein kinase [Blastocatellia bacterium]